MTFTDGRLARAARLFINHLIPWIMKRAPHPSLPDAETKTMKPTRLITI
jgi:hypothetical protein